MHADVATGLLLWARRARDIDRGGQQHSGVQQ